MQTPDQVILVCGFGRCGTSLVMQMLHAGGVPTTGKWPVFEDESAIGSLIGAGRQNALSGKAVKLLDPHLDVPPRGPVYTGIWLDRDFEQQARSQAKLIRFVDGRNIGRRGRRALERSFRRQLPRALETVASSCVAWERLAFEDILAHPEDAAMTLARLAARPFDTAAAARAVIPRSAACLKEMLEVSMVADRYLADRQVAQA